MNYIFAYYQAIEDGSVIVGRWTRRLYERIVSGIESGEFIFDQGKANNAIRFIEKYVRHNKGVLAPQLLKLELWQKAALSCIFGIVDEDGKRTFQEVFMVVGRKCGKTLLCAGICAYIAYADGEYGSEIYMVAPKLDQSDLVYSAFEFTKDNTPAFAAITEKKRYDLHIKATNTTIKKIAFNEKKADGYNPMLTIADELSSWPAERGLKQYEVMTSGDLTREEPLMVGITSGGYVNDGIFDELFKRSTRWLMGDSKEKRLLPIIYQIDDIDKWDDINELQKSLPQLGKSIPVKRILDKIEAAHESLPRRVEFITKYCDVKQNSSQAWLAAETVAKMCGEPLRLDDFKKMYCVGGLDLSMTTDLTASCVVIEKEGEFYVFAHAWLPAEKIEEATERDGLPYNAYIERGLLSPSGDNAIDYNDCYEWFRNLVEQYQILPLKVGYDRWSSQYLVQHMAGYGFNMDDVYQGDNLYGVIQDFEALAKDGKIHIGDNDLLKVHLLDGAIKMSTERGRGKLVKIHPTAHIDLTAALLDAFTVRQKWWPEVGAQLTNQR